MSTIDKARIIVVGDAGVGKSSLVHLICHGEPIANPYWTIGCSVEVKLHEYRAGTPQEKTYFIELWDIGGWTAHRSSRSTFYNPVHGIVLVHDLTNRKSQQNLRKWLTEVLNRDCRNTSDDVDYDAEQLAGSSVPMIVVGTKLDQTSSESVSSRTSNIADECGADEIKLDCTHTKHLAAGIGNAVKLSRFFDKVIEYKTGCSRDNTTTIPPLERRRPFSASSSYSKFSHTD